MISGIRNPSPISISSPRDTMTSCPAASSFSTRNTAAALLFTTIAGLPRDAGSSQPYAASRLPRLAGFQVIFEIGISRNGPKVRERGTAEIGVKNHARGVNHGTQRWFQQAASAAVRRSAQQRRPALRRLCNGFAPLRENQRDFIGDQLPRDTVQMVNLRSTWSIDGRLRSERIPILPYAIACCISACFRYRPV